MCKYNYHDFLAFMGIGGAHPGGLALTKTILNNAQLDQSSHVLDAGCGTGQTAAFIAKTYGCHVTAIDHHPVMIEKAKQRFKAEDIKVDLMQGNIEYLPFSEATFDLILAESVTVFTEIEQTISEYARLLRQDGILFDGEMTAIPPLPQAMREKFQQLYGISYIPSENGWQAKYKQAGSHQCEVIHEEYVEQSIYNRGSQVIDEKATEFFASDSIDPSIFQIWDEHQLLTERYAAKLKYTVFRANK